MDNTAIFIILLLSAALLTPYLYIHISASLSVGKSVPPYNDFLVDGTDTDKTIFFYFMSSQCSMCKTMTPAVLELQSTNSNIIVIDAKQFSKLAKSFHVFGTPTLMAVNGNVIAKVKLGGLSNSKIRKFIAR